MCSIFEKKKKKKKRVGGPVLTIGFIQSNLMKSSDLSSKMYPVGLYIPNKHA